MKGLLHRLVDRATGGSPTVRSDALLPFGADRLDDPDVLHPVDDGAMADERATATRTQQPPTRQTSTAPADTHAATSGLALETHIATSGAPLRHETPSSARSPAVLSSRSSPRRSNDVGAPDTATAAQLPPHPFAANPFNAPHPDPDPDPDSPALASAPRKPDKTTCRTEAPSPIAAMPALPESEQRQPTAPARVTLAAPAPAPLLSPGDVRLKPSRHDVSAHGDAHSSAKEGRVADDATEVHVHIGRIEVTAVHEAPTPRPRRDKRQVPLSLDAYLAARAKS